MTDKGENMIDDIINAQVEEADYEEEERNDSDGRKEREARSEREKAEEPKAEEKGTSDENKTKPKIPKRTTPVPMPLSRARRAREGPKENKTMQEKKTEVQQQGKQETREKIKGLKGLKGGKGKGKGKGTSETKEWKTFIFHQGVSTPQGATDIKRGATQLMEIGLGVVKDMKEIMIENENKLTVTSIVELSVIQNMNEVVNTFELNDERISMSKLG